MSRFQPSYVRRSTPPTQVAFTPVRQLFGGHLREATTGAAPIAPEILEFFYAGASPCWRAMG